MRLSVLCGEPPELDQSRFLGMGLQAKLPHTVAEALQEPLGFLSVLESHHEVVGVAHDD